MERLTEPYNRVLNLSYLTFPFYLSPMFPLGFSSRGRLSTRLEGLTKMSAKVFLLLSLYFFSCNAEESLLEYCGKDSYSYTPLRKGPKGQEYSLKQVHVIIR